MVLHRFAITLSIFFLLLQIPHFQLTFAAAGDESTTRHADDATTSFSRVAVVFGATGATGFHVVRQALLSSPRKWDRVVAVTGTKEETLRRRLFREIPSSTSSSSSHTEEQASAGRQRESTQQGRRLQVIHVPHENYADGLFSSKELHELLYVGGLPSPVELTTTLMSFFICTGTTRAAVGGNGTAFVEVEVGNTRAIVGLLQDAALMWGSKPQRSSSFGEEDEEGDYQHHRLVLQHIGVVSAQGANSRPWWLPNFLTAPSLPADPYSTPHLLPEEVQHYATTMSRSHEEEATSSWLVRYRFFHPLLYVRTLGLKQDAVAHHASAIPSRTVFQPGILNRLQQERDDGGSTEGGSGGTWGARLVTTLLYRFIGLRVDTLALAMLRDAEAALDRYETVASGPAATAQRGHNGEGTSSSPPPPRSSSARGGGTVRYVSGNSAIEGLLQGARDGGNG